MAALVSPNLVHPHLLDADSLAQLAGLGVLRGTNTLAPNETVLSLDWPELERVLPDRGLPRGVVEIASHITKRGALAGVGGGATTIALSAIRAVHTAADANGRAWCAWITESSNACPLYAPAVVQAGVDLDRLLIVRPSPADLARTVVKVAASGAFDLVVVDAPMGLDGKLAISGSRAGAGNGGAKRAARVDGAVIVRKLALAAEEKGTTFLLLTNVFTSRAVPWPVALRMEVERRPEAIAVRITKDRRGRSSSQHVVRVAC